MHTRAIADDFLALVMIILDSVQLVSHSGLVSNLRDADRWESAIVIALSSDSSRNLTLRVKRTLLSNDCVQPDPARSDA